MHTLFDFISNVNGVEYALGLLFMLGFVVLGEILKPKPFQGLVKAVADDIGFIKSAPDGRLAGLLKSLAMAPLCALFYLAAVPVLFVHGIAVLCSKIIAATTAIGFSPVQAYFTGRRHGRKSAPRAQK
ncbi:MAG TPA: hypothetical protein VK448_01025 [Dissulfurispiraceae bacterium]|nr:hypothetical protein [Dissulfurispiraceae bacterium]